METLQSSRPYRADSALSGNIPHTPPYTPRAKRRIDHTESPASVTSIQPTETVSPAKKGAERPVEDEVNIQELAEGDAGYITDMDVVYPHELEEFETSSSENDSDSDGEESDTGITEHFERLGCDDSEEIEFVRKRRQKHVRKRTGSKVFKRSHSQSAEGEQEVTDPDAMADHDLTSSARRLRRRVRGPSGVEMLSDDVPMSSPEPQQLASPMEMRERRDYRQEQSNDARSPSDGDAMDVDDSD